LPNVSIYDLLAKACLAKRLDVKTEEVKTRAKAKGEENDPHAQTQRRKNIYAPAPRHEGRGKRKEERGKRREQ
jgi:hypothetical protein